MSAASAAKPTAKSAAPASPLTKTHAPTEQTAVADIVLAAQAAATPIYPSGGGTSLDYGLPAKDPGEGIALTKLNRVIDYPARDMTITVEAGLTFAALAEVLATERQQLPFDVPQPKQATLGGIVATNFNGPRRFGLGAIRDYVIGITAVDGRGSLFHGGGRVVKNVAGYDFCKLLTGSLGTLGIITQLTFKVRPQPEATSLVVAEVPDEVAAEKLLVALITSQTTPVAVELLGGPAWQSQPELAEAAAFKMPRGLIVLARLEGTAVEVAWQEQQLDREWRAAGGTAVRVLSAGDALWHRLIQFPALPNAALVLKADVASSGVAPLLHAAREIDPQVSFVAHAGSGTVLLRYPTFPEKGITATLVGRLQPAAAAYDGGVVILSAAPGTELTHRVVWGHIGPAKAWMLQVKRQFDPRNVLNRGRFVYSG